tara:strand:+ start:84 stop:500 length:417 start_codon:yes stop_codon:yes gene_type:complete
MFGHNPLGIPMDNNLLISSSPQEFVQMWLDTVCTHDASAITALYLPDGVLLGTVAKKIKYGLNEIRSYFDMFVQKKPCGVITEISSKVYHNIAIVNGTYTFEIQEGKKKVQVPARFTFVLNNINGNWKIDTHHSSAQP